MWSVIEKNRWLAIAGVVVACLLIQGCFLQPTAESPISGEQKTSPQLQVEYTNWLREQQAEIESVSALYELSQQEIQQKQDAIDKVVTFVSGVVAESVPSQWAGLIPFGLSLLGVGAAADNLRKDRVIKTQKDKLNQVGEKSPDVGSSPL